MSDILFLTHRVPYPPDRGDRIRSFQMLKALMGIGRVHLAAFSEGPPDAVHMAVLCPMLGRVHVERRTRSTIEAGVRALASGRPISLEAFESAGMRTAVARMLAEEPIDTIVAFSGQMAQYVPEDRPGLRFVMDFVDVDSAKFAAYAEQGSWPMRAIHAREAARLAVYEQQVAERADISLFVSDVETEMFRQRSGFGPDRVATLENGIDLDFYRPDAEFRPIRVTGPLIVFTGQMDYRPNIEAVSDFATRAMPEIVKRFPSARFAIVGRAPTAAVRSLADRPAVMVTGAVPDVRPWLAAADVVVAPLRVARGVQNKVLEAMAMARPIVASPAAFQGIHSEAGTELIVSDDPAYPVASLLADRSRAEAMGRAARRRMELRYGWDARLAPFADYLGRTPPALWQAA